MFDPEAYIREHARHLNNKRFELLCTLPVRKDQAVAFVQRAYDYEHDPAPWCVHYRGGGHYFKTYTEVEAYCYERFRAFPDIRSEDCYP